MSEKNREKYKVKVFQQTDNQSPEDGIRTGTWMQVFSPS
jgi:hypothetical protein